MDASDVIPGESLSILGVRPHRYFIRLGSTNTEAAAWALRGAPEGAVVVAEEQTTGRGRRGRVWAAAPYAALLISVVLRPRVTVEYLPRLTFAGAVALADVLSVMGLQPRIKWPNDVLLNGRKAAGILAEGVWQSTALAAVILGCGINVFHEAVPGFAAAQATSIEDALGSKPDRWALLAALLARIDFWRQRVADPALLDAWREYSSTLGQRVTVLTEMTAFTGLAEAVDDTGALLLRDDEGKRHRLLAGDVTLQKNT